mmetsp:Transcript_19918/g.25660  ORF Transcript_19918/g.25660 Transcript_19918/m.25660 type:complete len:99 (-) Transcript_19918:131-427(-)
MWLPNEIDGGYHYAIRLFDTAHVEHYYSQLPEHERAAYYERQNQKQQQGEYLSTLSPQPFPEPADAAVIVDPDGSVAVAAVVDSRTPSTSTTYRRLHT